MKYVIGRERVIVRAQLAATLLAATITPPAGQDSTRIETALNAAEALISKSESMGVDVVKHVGEPT